MRNASPFFLGGGAWMQHGCRDAERRELNSHDIQRDSNSYLARFISVTSWYSLRNNYKCPILAAIKRTVSLASNHSLADDFFSHIVATNSYRTYQVAQPIRILFWYTIIHSETMHKQTGHHPVICTHAQNCWQQLQPAIGSNAGLKLNNKQSFSYDATD